MTDPSHITCFCAHLRRASRAVSRVYEEELRSQGLGANQYSILTAIKSMPGIRQRDLGKLLSMDSTTLSRTLTPLLRAQWVAVDRGEDKRERCFTLSVPGRELLAKAKKSWNRAQKKLQTELGETRWASLRGDLMRTTSAAEDIAEGRGLYREAERAGQPVAE